MTQFHAITRRACLSIAIAAGLGSIPPLARADPSVVKLVLPNATGSGVDALARAVQPALGRAFNAAVVVENQPGAGGIVGLQNLARSAPDGATLALVSNNVVIFPSVMKSVPFDVLADFTPIAVIGDTPMVLVVNPNRVPARSAGELMELLRKKPGQLNFGSGGNGTILHLATELYLEAANVKATHVPYKGVGAMVTELMGGQIDFATTALSSVQGQIKAGSLRAIGVMTPKRSPIAPDIPTLAEQGLKDFSVDAWLAIIGPKNLPAATVSRVHDGIVKAFKDPGVLDAVKLQGVNVDVSTPEQAQAKFRAEFAKYAALVKKVGLEPQ